MEEPSPKFFRLFIGNQVRLRYGYIVKCTGFEKDSNHHVTKVLCEYLPDTKSGTPGSDSVKVKGNLHWVSKTHSHLAEIRLYDKLFNVEHPGNDDTNYLEQLNPNSCITIQAQLEQSLKTISPGAQFQFERHGYFVADIKDSKSNHK
jgi:glutaminyl-tRNA synthetase